MPSSHFPALLNAFRETAPAGYVINNDGNRYWYVDDLQGNEVAKWECRPFPGCSALITTTQFVVHEPHRGNGLGRTLRTWQHNAYKKAGFQGEIATVRSDNAAMNAFMSGTVIDEFHSDFGGTFKVWLTKFDQTPPLREIVSQAAARFDERPLYRASIEARQELNTPDQFIVDDPFKKYSHWK